MIKTDKNYKKMLFNIKNENVIFLDKLAKIDGIQKSYVINELISKYKKYYMSKI